MERISLTVRIFYCNNGYLFMFQRILIAYLSVAVLSVTLQQALFVLVLGIQFGFFEATECQSAQPHSVNLQIQEEECLILCQYIKQWDDERKKANPLASKPTPAATHPEHVVPFFTLAEPLASDAIMRQMSCPHFLVYQDKIRKGHPPYLLRPPDHLM